MTSWKEGFSVIQTSGVAMSRVKQVNKIPTIRGTDIMRDPRLNKVLYVTQTVVFNLSFEESTFSKCGLICKCSSAIIS